MQVLWNPQWRFCGASRSAWGWKQPSQVRHGVYTEVGIMKNNMDPLSDLYHLPWEIAKTCYIFFIANFS